MERAVSKIRNAAVDCDGMVFRHVVVTLNEQDSIATFREDLSRWIMVQGAPH